MTDIIQELKDKASKVKAGSHVDPEDFLQSVEALTNLTDLPMKSLHVEGNEAVVDFVSPTWFATFITEHLLEMMGDALNFVSMEITHPDLGPLELSLQRVYGQTAVAQLTKAEDLLNNVFSILADDLEGEGKSRVDRYKMYFEVKNFLERPRTRSGDKACQKQTK